MDPAEELSLAKTIDHSIGVNALPLHAGWAITQAVKQQYENDGWKLTEYESEFVGAGGLPRCITFNKSSDSRTHLIKVIRVCNLFNNNNSACLYAVESRKSNMKRHLNNGQHKVNTSTLSDIFEHLQLRDNKNEKERARKKQLQESTANMSSGKQEQEEQEEPGEETFRQLEMTTEYASEDSVAPDQSFYEEDVSAINSRIVMRQGMFLATQYAFWTFLYLFMFTCLFTFILLYGLTVSLYTHSVIVHSCASNRCCQKEETGAYFTR
jgi:hypothetical protein